MNFAKFLSLHTPTSEKVTYKETTINVLGRTKTFSQCEPEAFTLRRKSGIYKHLVDLTGTDLKRENVLRLEPSSNYEKHWLFLQHQEVQKGGVLMGGDMYGLFSLDKHLPPPVVINIVELWQGLGVEEEEQRDLIRDVLGTPSSQASSSVETSFVTPDSKRPRHG